MKFILKQIISLSLLSIFLMANMGFALIHHSCHDCNTNSKEVQLFVLTHSHSDKEEKCIIEQCSSDNHKECACNYMDLHEEECQIEVNRLTTPFIATDKNIQIPKIEIFSVDYITSLKAFESQVSHFSQIFKSVPNRKPVWGIDLLIVHSVFRL